VKKALYSVADLDRVVKFLDGLNKLGAAHKVGFTSYEEILLVMDGDETPFAFRGDVDGSAVSLVVSM
jgi:hypothetical protein